MRRTAGAAFVLFYLLASPVHGQDGGRPSVSFLTPSDGTKIGGPTAEVALRIENFRAVEAGRALEEGEGHAHILIDSEPPPDRTYLATDDPSIIHLGKPPFDARSVELSEGRHTLYAVLGDSEHLVVEGQRVDKAVVEVAPGFRASGPLQPACAEVATGNGEVRLVFPIAGGDVQGTITARCSFDTQDGDCSWADVSFRRIDGRFEPLTGGIDGTAAGTSDRTLVDGSRGDCGEDRKRSIADSRVNATFANGRVNGKVGPASFALEEEPDLKLAAPEADPEAKTAGGDASGGRRMIGLLAFGAAALVLAGSVLYLVRSRPAK